MKKLKTIVDFSNEYRMPKVLDWLKSTGICDVVSVRINRGANMLSIANEKDFSCSIVLSIHPNSRNRQYPHDIVGNVQDITSYIHEILSQASLKQEDISWVFLIEEDSSGVGYPYDLFLDLPIDHCEAYNNFYERLCSCIRKMDKFPSVKKIGAFGFSFSAHMYAKAGCDCLIIERTNDDVDDFQTGIAFSRGAAKQYKKQWGVDFSLWWGPIFGCVAELPALYHKRNLYLSYFSGADCFLIEGGDVLLRETTGEKTLFASMLEDFYRSTKNIDQGTVDIPCAVIIPHDAGTMTQPYWRAGKQAWNYAKLPYRPGECGIDGLFGYFFPGSVFATDPFPFGAYASDDPPASPFSMARIGAEYCKNESFIYEAFSPVPFGKFHNREEAFRYLANHNEETSDYRGMGNSTFGDIFDVLSDEANLDAISSYRCLILAGPVQLTHDLKNILTNYMNDGGTVVTCAGIVKPDDSDFTEITMQPILSVGSAWSYNSTDFIHEAFRFCPIESFSDKQHKIIMKDSTGHPLWVMIPKGKGYLYVCAIPWYEAGHTDIAKACETVLSDIITPLQPVYVKGLPIEWLSTSISDCKKIVVLSNNSGVEWKGTVSLPLKFHEKWICRKLHSEEILKSGKNGQLLETSIKIPAYDVLVIIYEKQ